MTRAESVQQLRSVGINAISNADFSNVYFALGSASDNLMALLVSISFGPRFMELLSIDAFTHIHTAPFVVLPGKFIQIFYRCAQTEKSRQLTEHIQLLGEDAKPESWPTPGFIHLRGDFATIPRLTWVQHCELIDACLAVYQDAPEPPQEPAEPESKGKPFRQPKTRPIAVGDGSTEVFLPAQAGAIQPNLDSVCTILETDPRLDHLVWYDTFLGRMLTQGLGNNSSTPVREWRDTDDLELTLYLQRRCGADRMFDAVVAKAVQYFASINPRNCVTDWLDSLAWDQEPRIAQCFSDHFGAVNTAYTQAASSNFWISLVARAYRPGCQVDHMVVFEGPQGIYKSRALRVIGGDYYCEQTENINNTRAFAEILDGKWLVEISEMDAFRGADVTRIKQMLTVISDRYRGAYLRRAADHPRQCVFAGTTNRNDWNRDDTGARRFWPIACAGDIDLEALTARRDQFFAEAVTLFKSGAPWWQMPRAETQAEQEDRYLEDTWSELIQEFLVGQNSTTVSEILLTCLKFDKSKIGKIDQMRVASCLRRLNWEKGKKGRVGIGGRDITPIWRPLID